MRLQCAIKVQFKILSQHIYVLKVATALAACIEASGVYRRLHKNLRFSMLEIEVPQRC